MEVVVVVVVVVVALVQGSATPVIGYWRCKSMSTEAMDGYRTKDARHDLGSSGGGVWIPFTWSHDRARQVLSIRFAGRAKTGGTFDVVWQELILSRREIQMIKANGKRGGVMHLQE